MLSEKNKVELDKLKREQHDKVLEKDIHKEELKQVIDENQQLSKKGKKLESSMRKITL